mmetsp:Transcript_30847/g.76726  ORF Transcript_30847/g.76726 Transcript_30847/m.76726 type:complete len:320 (+) Transcript_30847:365-1324(+)
MPGAAAPEPRGLPARLGRHHCERGPDQAGDAARRLRGHPRRGRRVHRAPRGGHVRDRLEGQGGVHPDGGGHGHPALRVLLHRPVRPAQGRAAHEHEVRRGGVPQGVGHELHGAAPVRLHAAADQRVRGAGAGGADAVGHGRRHAHRVPGHPGHRQDDVGGGAARGGQPQGADAGGPQGVLGQGGDPDLREAGRRGGQGDQGAGAAAEGDAGPDALLPVDRARRRPPGVRRGAGVRREVRRAHGGDVQDPGHGRQRDHHPGGLHGGVLLEDPQEAQGGGRRQPAEGLLPVRGYGVSWVGWLGRSVGRQLLWLLGVCELLV